MTGGRSGGTRRRERALSDDDRAVWESVARQIRRRSNAPHRASEPDGTAKGAAGDKEVAPQAGHTLPAPDAAPASAEDPLAQGTSVRRGWKPTGPPARATLTTVQSYDPAPQPVGRPQAGIDKRTADRLRRGTRAPDARIDLHGMTAERAHRALLRFVADALQRDLRCILVITGKGGRGNGDGGGHFSRDDRGVLRQDAPRWLRVSPYAREIVGIFEAHRRHGGAGAFYVYLKRRR